MNNFEMTYEVAKEFLEIIKDNYKELQTLLLKRSNKIEIYHSKGRDWSLILRKDEDSNITFDIKRIFPGMNPGEIARESLNLAEVSQYLSNIIQIRKVE